MARFTSPTLPMVCLRRRDDDPQKELQVNGVYRIPNARQQKPGAPPDRDQLQLIIKVWGGRMALLFLRTRNSCTSRDREERMDAVPRAARRIGDGWDAISRRLVISGGGGTRRHTGRQEGEPLWVGPGWRLDHFPEGKHLGTIPVPERVSNVAWGDADGKTLYITASTSVYRIKLNIPGVRN